MLESNLPSHSPELVPTEPPEMSPGEAVKLLHYFTRLDTLAEQILAEQTLTERSSSKDLAIASPALPPTYTEICAALAVVLEDSSYQILGICAPDFSSAQRSLMQYLAALGYDDQPAFSQRTGPCYIKYNTKNRKGYVEPYSDPQYGVLIACQSSYDDGVNETFGYFPLDFFQP